MRKIDYRKLPYASISIALLCVIVGALQLARGDAFTYKFVMFEGAIQLGEGYRILTSAFIHFGFEHFACNMLSLIAIGTMVERYLGLVRYIILYGAGIIGSGFFVNFFGGTASVHGGASGAIWALMLATLVIKAREKQSLSGILKCLVFNLAYSFYPGVSWQGHIGGGIAGLIATTILIFTWKTPKERKDGKVLFTCPECGQRATVPKGPGFVKIVCPRCGKTYIGDRNGSFSS